MNIEDLLSSIHQESGNRSYILQYDILDRSQSILKVRLYITADLFVQIYRNTRFNSTSLTLVHNRQRLYARDQINGIWHRHPLENPESHDNSRVGRRHTTLKEFLDEVEAILANLNLP